MHRRHPVRAGAAALIAALLLGAAHAAGASGALAAAVGAPLREIGSGSLHWFGLHVYDARLAVAGEKFDPAQPFALTLRYAREFKGERIAQTSIDEIRRLGFGAAVDHERWLEAMRRVFPDVKRGDELTGAAVPGRGTEFFHNGRLVGTIDDPGFARAFYAIWLDPRTQVSELRAQLLGASTCRGAGPNAPPAARC
jgi:hypothetical protein